MSAAREVYANGGLKSFANGIGPRALSNGINSAVFFCFFEALRKVFAHKVGGHDHLSVGIFLCIKI